MTGLSLAHWLPALILAAMWPAAIVVLVLAALLLAPREQLTGVLSGIAQIVRAARQAPEPTQRPVPEAGTTTVAGCPRAARGRTVNG